MTDPAPPLLRTKLRAPARRAGAVPRPRLATRLAGPDAPPLTLVAAPAGFGKTTLVAEALAGDPTTAWLSLDTRDDDPQVFWAYVAAAVDTALADAGRGARAVLASGRASPDAVVAALLNDLDAVSGDLVLVLDDVHAITSSEITGALAYMVERLPPGVRLVMIGRADPALPLAGLRARGVLGEIRAADLRFSVEEAAAYLTGAMGLPLAPAQVEALERRTEGWIAALQLAALSLRGREDVAGFIAGFAGDDRFVLDYLAGEVLERQPAEVRDFLLRTSILGRMTGPLCDAVTGGTGGAATLTELERSGLFVIPLDDRRAWYRYHHLFADVLQVRLRDEHPGDVAGLHRRASQWAEDEGDLPEAVHHALAAGDAMRAAALVERAAPAMRRTRQEASLRRWLDALPEAIVVERPALALALVGARMATGDFADAPRLLQGVEERLAAGSGAVADPEEARLLPAQAAMYRAALALVGGDLGGTLSHAERALALAGPDDDLPRGAAEGLAGLALWSAGDLAGAHARYTASIAHLTRAGHVSDVLGCSLALSDIETAQGRLGAAAATLRDGLALAAPLGAVRGVPDMHAGLASIGLDQGDVDGAIAHMAAAEAAGEHAGLPQYAYRSRVVRARLAELRGDTGESLALLEEAGRRFDSDLSPVVHPVPALIARLRLRSGDITGAVRWARERGLGPDDPLAYVTEFDHVTLARVFVATGDADAAPLIARLLEAAEAGGRQGTVADLLALRADAGRGDAATASDLSEREREVLRLLATDLSGPDIARELVVSLNTVRTHTKHIYVKLGVTSRRAAVRRAAELGL